MKYTEELCGEYSKMATIFLIILQKKTGVTIKSMEDSYAKINALKSLKAFITK